MYAYGALFQQLAGFTWGRTLLLNYPGLFSNGCGVRAWQIDHVGSLRIAYVDTLIWAEGELLGAHMWCVECRGLCICAVL